MQTILIIDDDRDMCLLLKRFLTRHGYEVLEAYNGKKSLELLETVEPSLVMCDFRLEDMEGNVLLGKIKERYPHLPVIIITGYSDIKIAVEVMKMGAYDYITKPLFPDEILVTIKKALESASLEEERTQAAPVSSGNDEKVERPVVAKEKTPNITVSGDYIFGDTPVFRQILQQIDLVAPTNYTVIIHGESGSGKEAVAQEIHKRSKRKSKPFVAIDCGALSKELAGSELFGHEKGSFTGALNQKVGSFELANTGTIFLDEVANLSYDIQVSLLRVVQERKMRRVGGVKDIELDVRIIIASNERLWDAVRKGKFREDLYHRFNEFSIDIPPLRQRPDDVMLFANHFLHQTNQELGKNIKRFSNEVENIFRTYVWYGNLRELRNVIKRATLLSDGEEIEASSLPFEISHFNKLQFDKQPEPAATNSIPTTINEIADTPRNVSETTLKGASIDAEYEMILKALKKVNFNKSKAAKLLNIDRKTLYNKMKQYQEFNNQ
ncbi:sigma-54-dependent transcriptional regulator [Flavisolibacter ginsengisoli]|jgi:two-component system, NtrC family, response regulator HydG|uniref:Two-component system, NtrC family, response regulator HydG n=1 Tax=Flavisolibacter ginsengisoli DSM 18119 TaxID=1121884 RepID=A0A1M5CX94_9BACT|nr:sigma-54 dependent transcriptional regulator [Flavisolibacter ginsengisoli]SHF59315.1 two-component system, NtrC family, response regulator HydG [Flavisolibacter ginsengisoli DSM 18119]